MFNIQNVHPWESEYMIFLTTWNYFSSQKAIFQKIQVIGICQALCKNDDDTNIYRLRREGEEKNEEKGKKIKKKKGLDGKQNK